MFTFDIVFMSFGHKSNVYVCLVVIVMHIHENAFNYLSVIGEIYCLSESVWANRWCKTFNFQNKKIFDWISEFIQCLTNGKQHDFNNSYILFNWPVCNLNWMKTKMNYELLRKIINMICVCATVVCKVKIKFIDGGLARRGDFAIIKIKE